MVSDFEYRGIKVLMQETRDKQKQTFFIANISINKNLEQIKSEDLNDCILKIKGRIDVLIDLYASKDMYLNGIEENKNKNL